jgi:uncharacterized membrane protein YgcG
MYSGNFSRQSIALLHAQGGESSLLRVILVFVLLALPVWAQEHYPAPQGRVSDFARVLDASTREKLNALITEVEQHTTAEIAVAVVRTTAPATPRQYATELFNRWGVGKKGTDNGVLILLAVQDRRVEIETGYGVEGVLPDGKAGEIIRTTMIPFFKENRWGEGLFAGTQRIAQVLRAQEQVLQTPAQPAASSLTWRGVLFGLGWVYFFVWLGFLVVQNMRHRTISSRVLAISTLPGVFFGLFAFFPFIIPLGVGLFALLKNVRARCPKCGNWLLRRQRTLQMPSATRTGLRETLSQCSECGYHDVQMTTLSRTRVRDRSGGVIWGVPGGWGGGSGGGAFPDSSWSSPSSSSVGSSDRGSFGGGSSGGGGAGASF